MPAITAHPQATVLNMPALVVVHELLFNTFRHDRAMYRKLLIDRWAVFLNDSIKESVLRAVAYIRRRADT